jgi:hypothetical protein
MSAEDMSSQKRATTRHPVHVTELCLKEPLVCVADNSENAEYRQASRFEDGRVCGTALFSLATNFVSNGHVFESDIYRMNDLDWGRLGKCIGYHRTLELDGAYMLPHPSWPLIGVTVSMQLSQILSGHFFSLNLARCHNMCLLNHDHHYKGSLF